MGNIITASVNDEQRDFIYKHDLSMSEIVQAKVEELMVAKNPSLITSYSKKNKKVETIWQRRLDDETDSDKRTLIIFESLEAVGIDTSNWSERKRIKRKNDRTKNN